MSVNCHVCKRTLHEGESATASDWTVFDFQGWPRLETRYTCDDCEATR